MKVRLSLRDEYLNTDCETQMSSWDYHAFAGIHRRNNHEQSTKYRASMIFVQNLNVDFSTGRCQNIKALLQNKFSSGICEFNLKSHVFGFCGSNRNVKQPMNLLLYEIFPTHGK